MRTAICFSCNEAYMPLCRGLVLSLKKVMPFISKEMDASLHFIDIGCETSSLAWLKQEGASLHVFSRKFYPKLPDESLLPRYADAQICRPHLPQLVPGYDCYVWIDSDIWVQGNDSITVAAEAAQRAPNSMIICPELHYGFIGHRNVHTGMRAAHNSYSALYDQKELVEDLSTQPMLNSGFFALMAQSPIWKLWADELNDLYARDFAPGHPALHLAEQFGLNKILYTNQAFVPLDPIFNYPCAASAVFISPRGVATVGFPPFTPLKNVHLLAFPHFGRTFLDRGFLFAGGSYLTPEERVALEGLLKKPGKVQ